MTVVPVEVNEDLGALIAALTPAPDVVFNALHGRFGEDGTIQGVLDYLGIPYTHSGVRASALAMDKAAAKAVFAHAGLPVAPHRIIEIAELADHDPLPPPYVVKPVNEGSSVGVHIVKPGDNRSAEIVRDWHFGAGDGGAIYSGARADGCACWRTARCSSPKSSRMKRSTIIMRNMRRAARAMSCRRSSPGGYHAACEGYRAGGAPGAGLPRRDPGGSAL